MLNLRAEYRSQGVKVQLVQRKFKISKWQRANKH